MTDRLFEIDQYVLHTITEKPASLHGDVNRIRFMLVKNFLQTIYFILNPL